MASFTSDFLPHTDGPLSIRLTGRLDGNSAPGFGRELAVHLHPTTTGVVIDVRGLEFISSAGLRELMTLARKLRQNKAKAVLVAAPPAVNEVLEISGMVSLFLRADNQDEALRLLSGGGGFFGRLFSGGSKA